MERTNSKQYSVSMVTCRLAFAFHKEEIISIYLHFQGFLWLIMSVLNSDLTLHHVLNYFSDILHYLLNRFPY